MLGTYGISLLSVIFFCGCCYGLMKSFTTPVPYMNQTEYSKAALRIAKGYRALAWGVMTLVFLLSLVSSFYAVFIEL